jgi:hypothetical protein
VHARFERDPSALFVAEHRLVRRSRREIIDIPGQRDDDGVVVR